ncbi:hypothetical protein AS181_01265 [Gordonia sp. SGD-V-85]|nr:hypothetical protein AS181_01265 [Gordonia sp. SGD-V-85]
MVANLPIGAIRQRGTVGFRTPPTLCAAASLVGQVFVTFMIVLYPTSVKRLTGGFIAARHRETGTIDV